MLDPEYVKRMEDWFDNRSSVLDIKDYSEGEEIIVKDKNIILNDTTLAGYPFPEFIKIATKHFGEKVETEGGTGTLIGISYTYLDWYYLIQNEERTWAETCVSKIKFLENLEN